MSDSNLQAHLRTRFADAKDYFGFPDTSIEVLGEAPTTVLLRTFKGSPAESLGMALNFIADWSLEFSGSKHELIYRAVGLDRLPLILETGCDVSPPDAVIFATTSPEKALEYGGSGKVLQVFKKDCLDRSYLVFDPGTAPSIVDEFRGRFPTEIQSGDGRIHLSRMPPGKFPGAGSGYELECGWFIPGDPLNALQMVFLAGESPDVLLGAYRAAKANRGRAAFS